MLRLFTELDPINRLNDLWYVFHPILLVSFLLTVRNRMTCGRARKARKWWRLGLEKGVSLRHLCSLLSLFSLARLIPRFSSLHRLWWSPNSPHLPRLVSLLMANWVSKSQNAQSQLKNHLETCFIHQLPLNKNEFCMFQPASEAKSSWKQCFLITLVRLKRVCHHGFDPWLTMSWWNPSLLRRRRTKRQDTCDALDWSPLQKGVKDMEVRKSLEWSKHFERCCFKLLKHLISIRNAMPVLFWKSSVGDWPSPNLAPNCHGRDSPQQWVQWSHWGCGAVTWKSEKNSWDSTKHQTNHECKKKWFTHYCVGVFLFVVLIFVILSLRIVAFSPWNARLSASEPQLRALNFDGQASQAGVSWKDSPMPFTMLSSYEKVVILSKWM